MKKNKKRNNMKQAKDVILSKFTSGREKGIQKRKKTLLMEYKLQNKSNKFVDRRIGERDRAMTNEDRIMARFVAQRVKAHNKKQIFNLDNEDEILTHHGRTLKDIEKYDNPQSESEDEEDGRLDADFVEKAHFGGGLFTKASNDDNHKSTIDVLIAESKKRKAERQQTKEETQTLTEKLDENLKELFPVFTNSNSTESEVTTKFAKDSYDVLVRELRFERIGKPTQKLRTEDQINAEERKKLLQLENERAERMKRQREPEDEEEDKPVTQEFLSADSLDDGFDLEIFDEEASGEDYSGSDGEGENSEEENDHTDGEAEQTKEDCMQLSSTDLKTSKVPASLEKLQKIISELDLNEKISKIENMLRDQQVHCGTSNKKHLMHFFSILLEYIDSLFSHPVNEDSWNLVDKLSPILFELVQLSGDTAAEIVYKRLAEKYSTFCAQKQPKITVDMLILLKIIPLLFPTSDYYHPVTTPASVFSAQILFKNPCSNLQLIAKGLFVASVILEYISLSRRFCPEVIIFLRNVLYTAAANYENTYPPVQVTNKILVLSDKCGDNSLSENARVPSSFILEDVPDCDRSKLILIHVSLKLLITFCELYESLSASYAVLSPIEILLRKLPIDSYPSNIRKAISELQSQINNVIQKPLNYLMAQKKRPKALRLYEPNIRPIIENRSLRTVSQAKLEREKLLRQYKKEKKGALKEIRKDRNFIARVKLSEQAKRDAERKNKVKQIFGWGQSQQSELKRMERKNRFKR